MKKIVWSYGLPAGLISLLGYALTTITGADHMMLSMIYGFASMILGFSLIFVAVKKYRETIGAGTITFGKAFLIGLYIVLIASTIYVVAWLIYYYNFFPDFPQKYAAMSLEQMRENGASAAEIAKTQAEMDEFIISYQNPLFVTVMTYVEILTVGLPIALLSAALLKRKPKLA